MFIVRAKLFKCLQNIIDFCDFGESKEEKKDPVSNVYIYERVLGFVVCAQWYKIKDFRLKNYSVFRVFRLIQFIINVIKGIFIKK